MFNKKQEINYGDVFHSKVFLAISIFIDTVGDLEEYFSKNKQKKKKHCIAGEYVLCKTILDDKNLLKYLLLISASFYSVNEFFSSKNRIVEKYTGTLLEVKAKYYNDNDRNFSTIRDLRRIIEHYLTKDDLYFQKNIIIKNKTLFYIKEGIEVSLIDELKKVSDIFLKLMLCENVKGIKGCSV